MKSDEYRQEAERLKLLTPQTQRDIVAMHKQLARNRKLSRKDRTAARRRAQALSRLLRRRSV